MVQKLFIFPFNGNGIEALDCVKDQFEFIGFIDDTPEKQGVHKLGFEVFDRSILLKYREAKLLAVPGSPTSFTSRVKTITEFNSDNSRYINLIHPTASVSPFAMIGHNTVIMAGVVITANSIIGNHVCILPNTVIHHDSNVGDYTLIGSNVTIAGNTTLGRNCYVGSGTNVINGITLGENTLVGIGTNVIKSFAAQARVVGNPARQINK
jgi:sugar O-acyltransferase (sialic acid O-acetyltransferase NeuD family)